MLFNNSGSTPSLIAEERERKLLIIDKDLFDRITKIER
jgi:hypothetical protein